VPHPVRAIIQASYPVYHAEAERRRLVTDPVRPYRQIAHPRFCLRKPISIRRPGWAGHLISAVTDPFGRRAGAMRQKPRAIMAGLGSGAFAVKPCSLSLERMIDTLY
jgi:hypothetical protein